MHRINADDNRKRILVASIPTKQMSYQHSVALTENYAIVFESPIHFDLKKMLLGYSFDMVLDGNLKDTTKIHAVRLSDGKVHTIDANIWSFVFHFGNSFEKDGKIFVDASSYEDPNVHPFNVFSYDRYFEENFTEAERLKV